MNYLVENKHEGNKTEYFKTDFEQIEFLKSELANSDQCIFSDDILLLRFINSALYEKYYKDESPYVIKDFFLLPTHKERELRESLKPDISGDFYFSEDLLEYYSPIMLESLNPKFKSKFQNRIEDNLVAREVRNNYSTSFFVLYNRDKISVDCKYTTETMLKTNDLNQLNEEEKKIYLIGSGLKICELLPLYNYLVAVGNVQSKQGILEWDGHPRGKDEPTHSHLDFFKGYADTNKTTFKNIATQFHLIDNTSKLEKIRQKKPRRRSNRRG